jgi:hypothetical protein
MRTAALVLLVLSTLGRIAPTPAKEGGGVLFRSLDGRTPRIADDTETTAHALFQLADKEEVELAFARAVGDYRACVDAAPHSRWAARASERADWLIARSEGDFVPLLRVERFRRDPALASDRVAIDELAHEADAFPPGVVRVEARMLVAEAWMGRMGRPEDAIAELRLVAQDPSSDPLTASLAEGQLVEALISGNRINEAANEAHAHASLLDARFVRNIDRLVRRRWVLGAAIATLVAFGALATHALFRAWQRRVLQSAVRALREVTGVAVPFTAFVAIAGGVLASRYESGNARPFLMLGAAALPLVLLARAWGAVGSPRPLARGSRAALCGATLLAAAFVLLDVVSPDYLEGFGL